MEKSIVKKLSVSMLLFTTFTLGGCAADKEEKPTQEPTEEVEKPTLDVQESKDLNLEKMTKEETLALTSGMEIDKLPDREVLESMGLDYEFEMGIENTFEDGKEETKKSSLYDVPEELRVKDIENEKGKYRSVQKFNCIRIISILDVELAPTGIWCKTITLSNDKTRQIPVLNEDNVEKIKAILGK